MFRTYLGLSLLLIVLLALSVGQAAAQTGGNYEITSYTIDGGGTVAATGGNYELNGTIGQADTGTAAGGSYTVHEGFWQPTTDGLPTSVKLNTTQAESNPITLLYIGLLVSGAVLFTLQLRAKRQP